jgi:hypothetical protein
MQMKKNAVILPLLVLFVFNFHLTSYAGFPVPKDYWMLSPMYSHYHASSYWNNTGKVIQYSSSGKFTSNYFGLYGAFGLEKDLNFVFNVPFIIQTYSNSNYLIQNSSLGDATAGLSYFPHLNSENQHLSVGGSLILPLYRNTLTIDTAIASSVSLPYTGFQELGLEAKVGYSGTNVNYLRNTYYDLEAGLRTYFGSGGPTQVFLNATFGVPLNENIKIAGTLSAVNSGSNSFNSSSSSTGVNKDFSYARLTFAAGVKISEQGSLWGNVFTDVSGRNIGLGSGFSLFAVFKF